MSRKVIIDTDPELREMLSTEFWLPIWRKIPPWKKQ